MIDDHALAAALGGEAARHDLTGRAVVDLTHDSRQVGPGWAFACVPGETSDGHDYARQAVTAGASVLITEHRLGLGIGEIVVGNCRRVLGAGAAAVHGHPAKSLTMVGVTGTNGKTTTTHMLSSLLGRTGWRERQIGTLYGRRTTPEAPDLQRQLATFVAEGANAVVMEVSSHALVMGRVDGMILDAAVFTNLGHDHLDLHHTAEAYFEAKASLFQPEHARVGVVNLDDPYGQRLAAEAPIEIVGYGHHQISEVMVTPDRHTYRWQGRTVEVPIGGAFNVDNSLAALTTAEILGGDLDDVVAALADMAPVPGRFELVAAPSPSTPAVIVDYAHTPDGLIGLLDSARTLGDRVIIVFGCGGERDVDKRPKMGAAAVAGADHVIVTSDNPRREDPDMIIDAIVSGITTADRHRVSVETDRRQAIIDAIGGADPGDIVVIAGKGHETTQTIGTIPHPFDDREIARAVLADPTISGNRAP